MDFIIGDRQTGKTTKLLEWMSEADRSKPTEDIRVYVGHNKQETMRVYRSTMHRDYGKSIFHSWQFVSVDELRSKPMWTGIQGRQNIRLGVDNLDLILPSMYGWPIDLITATGEIVG